MQIFLTALGMIWALSVGWALIFCPTKSGRAFALAAGMALLLVLWLGISATQKAVRIHVLKGNIEPTRRIFHIIQRDLEHANVTQAQRHLDYVVTNWDRITVFPTSNSVIQLLNELESQDR